MSDSKISQLTELTTPATEDLLAIVDDPAGTPTTKKVTLSNLLSLVYPVGSIYISVTSTNPGTLFGGTWVAFGAGKTLVGINAAETEFDTVEETGGAKTHTLSTSEMPSHTHTNNQWLNNGAQASGNHYGFGYMTDTGALVGGTGSGETPYNNSNTGGGEAHNNLQPYIVTYIWKRTA